MLNCCTSYYTEIENHKLIKKCKKGLKCSSFCKEYQKKEEDKKINSDIDYGNFKHYTNACLFGLLIH